MTFYDEYIARLIRCSMTAELPEQEKKELEQWLSASEANRLFYKKITREIRSSSEGTLYRSLDEEAAWCRLQRVMKGEKKTDRILCRRNWWRYAAVLLLPIALWTVWYFSGQSRVEVSPESYASITPGTSQALLVTADGKSYPLKGYLPLEIKVGEHAVAKQQGEELVYTDAGHLPEQAYNTLKIPRGGEFKLVLSDGTKVYLNAMSDLRYPITFDEKERRVYLTGEAYFEVAKDVNRPFYVVVEDMQVQVYGTIFNINTHYLESVRTVLVEGSISVKALRDDREVLITPGELAVYNRKSKTFDVSETDIRPYIAWMEGYFVFDNGTLEQIMSTLSMWYDVDVFFTSESAKDYRFTGSLRRYGEIDEILGAITDVVDVKFSKKDRTIVVSK